MGIALIVADDVHRAAIGQRYDATQALIPMRVASPLHGNIDVRLFGGKSSPVAPCGGVAENAENAQIARRATPHAAEA